MGLPFLVEWGEWVWRGAFAVLVVLGALWAWWTPRRQSRNEAHAWCPEPTPSDRFEVGALAILEGPLAPSGMRSVLVPRAAVAGIVSGSDFASDQLPLVIETEAGLVELSGPIRLMVGGVEQRPLRTFRRETPLHARVCALPDGPLLAAKLEGRRYAIKSIAPGARVRARGSLRRRSDAHAEGAYRETRGRWVLEGSEADPIFLASSLPPKLRQLDIARAGIGATLGALLFAGVFIGGAAVLHRSLSSTENLGPSDETAAVLLSATPLQRDLGLRSVRSIWHRSGPLSEESAERLATLIERIDGCGGVAAFWNTHGNTVKALVAAHACSGQRALLEKVRAHYARGDMQAASGLVDRMHVDASDLAYSATHLEPAISPSAHATGAARAHLARGRWRTAARQLDAVWGHEGARCVGAIARARTGDPLSAIPTGATRCSVLHASEARPEVRLAQLEFLAEEQPVASLMIHEVQTIRAVEVTPIPSNVSLADLESPEGQRVMQRLALERRSSRAQRRAIRRRLSFEIPTDLGCPLDPDGVPAIERLALARMGEMRQIRGAPQHAWAVLAIRRALFEAVAGNPDAARGLLDQAVALSRTTPGELESVRRIIESWNEEFAAPPMSDEAVAVAWKSHGDDRRVLLRTSALSPSARALVQHGHDRPVMGTFREHFCDASAHAVAARRAGLDELADEQRAIANVFKQLLLGRRAAVMYWTLEESSYANQWDR